MLYDEAGNWLLLAAVRLSHSLCSRSQAIHVQLEGMCRMHLPSQRAHFGYNSWSVRGCRQEKTEGHSRIRLLRARMEKQEVHQSQPNNAG